MSGDISFKRFTSACLTLRTLRNAHNTPRTVMFGVLLALCVTEDVWAVVCDWRRAQVMNSHLTKARLLEDAMCLLSNIAFVSDEIRLSVGRSVTGTIVDVTRVFNKVRPVTFCVCLCVSLVVSSHSLCPRPHARRHSIHTLAFYPDPVHVHGY